jgi:hypothetical protein
MDIAQSDTRRAGVLTYCGVFLITLATLMFEILLTRIFSVTMFYHYAFMAISVAMFGMTLGAMTVYLLPRVFTPAKTVAHMSVASILFAVTAVLSILLHIGLGLSGVEGGTRTGALLGISFAAVAVPLTFSGVVVCLALTRFPRQVGRLYAADLAGAALGCILFLGLLHVTDGPTAVFVIAALGALGAMFFAFDARVIGLNGCGAVLTLGLAGFAVWHTGRVEQGQPLIRIAPAMDEERVGQVIHETWNAHSRVTLMEMPADRRDNAFGWGMSPKKRPPNQATEKHNLIIDATAATVMTKFTGRLDPESIASIAYLKNDLTNMAHHLRQDARVAVVGAGGGRDVLSALAFEQASVTAIEINADILGIVNGVFGDYTGHLDRIGKVHFVNDEARSYLSRTDESFDILQISMIDTWAATAAGAFALTENSLYTLEAFDTFIRRLSDRGILTVSRWCAEEQPAEMLRLVALAAESLRRAGVESPRDHLMIARFIPRGRPDRGVGNLMLSKSPFTQTDRERLKETCDDLRFEVVLTPWDALDPAFAEVVEAPDIYAFARDYPLDISPPDDESPFYFNVLRLRDFMDQDLWERGNKAIVALLTVLGIVLGLTLLCIIVPLGLTMRRVDLSGSFPLFLYFAGIGLGFMFIEVSQMQRLNIFLGHPTYSLAVVLFSVLLFSSAGSMVTELIGESRFRGLASRQLFALLAVLVLFGLVTVPVIRMFDGGSNAVRIAVSIAIIGALGFFMGMAFPLGMKEASRLKSDLTPWLWGINGAMSVCASVVTVVVSLAFGISTAYWVGAACYAVAVLAFLAFSRRRAAA